ncbi:hypothetical protein ACWGHI_21350, partial [Streptomyces sp. NPDC054912]
VPATPHPHPSPAHPPSGLGVMEWLPWRGGRSAAGAAHRQEALPEDAREEEHVTLSGQLRAQPPAQAHGPSIDASEIPEVPADAP